LGLEEAAVNPQQKRKLSGVSWDYDRTELAVDGIVHVLGLGSAAIGAVALLVHAVPISAPWELGGVLIYVSALLAALAASAAYNMWPVSPTKWILRRIDHSAIYLLIAGTYTPFLSQVRAGMLSSGLLIGVWATALVGVGLKLAMPGRFDRLSILLYLVVGWSGVLAYQAVVATLPTWTVVLILAGGLLYTAGVIFHVWKKLRFQNAIWHTFVLLAAACHYGAVLDCMILAKS
jgi:hemolysin III